MRNTDRSHFTDLDRHLISHATIIFVTTEESFKSDSMLFTRDVISTNTLTINGYTLPT